MNLLHHLSLSPLSITTTIYVLGIILQYHYSQSIYTLPIIGLVFLLWACFDKNIYIISIAIIVMSFGALRYHQTISNWHTLIHDISQQTIDINGIVMDRFIIPQKKIASLNILVTKSCHTNLIGSSILIYISDYYADIDIGRSITIHNLQIKKPSQENFCDYLIKEGITATSYIDIRQIVLNTNYINPLAYINLMRLKILKSLQQQMQTSTAILFSSLFLGYKKATSLTQQTLLDNLTRTFKNWGASHYIARSGLHITAVTLTWELFLRLMPFNWVVKQIILIILGFTYALLSWPSVSFTRSFVTFILIKFIFMTKYFYHFLHTLFFILLILIWFKPILIFFLDFQLTFGLTIALSMYTNISAKRYN